VTGTAFFTSVTLPVWPRDDADITKGEAGREALKREREIKGKKNKNRLAAFQQKRFPKDKTEDLLP